MSDPQELRRLADRVEEDIRALLLENGRLRHALHEERKERREETKELLRRLLEVMDSFENVFAAMDDPQRPLDERGRGLLGNFRTVCNLLGRVLRQQGVQRLSAQRGEHVDPFRHQVVETVRAPAAEADTIWSEVRPGYRWNDEVLRAGEVVAVEGE